VVADLIRGGRPRLALTAGGLALCTLALSLAGGYLFARLGLPLARNRMFPWIAGRALGLGAYLALTAAVTVGLWVRHPWRFRFPLLHPETRVRVHASLAAATLVLVAGHVAALASDRYAGVGWLGALLPGPSHYRTWPVALGVVALYGMVAISGTAALAGRLLGHRWLAVHRLALPTYGLVWFHGVLAGTDAPRLRIAYLLTGLVPLVVYLSGRWARQPLGVAARP
jgi:hypothetical protein